MSLRHWTFHLTFKCPKFRSQGPLTIASKLFPPKLIFFLQDLLLYSRQIASLCSKFAYRPADHASTSFQSQVKWFPPLRLISQCWRPWPTIQIYLSVPRTTSATLGQASPPGQLHTFRPCWCGHWPTYLYLWIWPGFQAASIELPYWSFEFRSPESSKFLVSGLRDRSCNTVGWQTKDLVPWG